ncbi:MAG TPA: gliding motility-associated C-terminal domain-containing protein [Puia sp.]|nr:gliding motility-associated C-terminal domain-containing protein [Puia sp.]
MEIFLYHLCRINKAEGPYKMHYEKTILLVFALILSLHIYSLNVHDIRVSKAKYSPEADTIISDGSNFQKQYNPPDQAMEPFCITEDKSNGYLLAGDFYKPSVNNIVTRTTSLFHIDGKGCVDWSKAMTPGQEEVIQFVISTSDSGYLVSAFPFQSQQDNYPRYLNIFKLDKSGNKVWAHSLSDGTNVMNYFSAVCETSDGGFAIEIGSFPLSGSPSGISIIKIDQSGRIVWGRKLSVENDAYYDIGGILEKGNYIYATGSVYQAVTPFDILRSFFVQLDKNTGQLIRTMKNDPAKPPLTFLDIHSYNDSLLINSYSQNQLNDFIFLDNEGNTGGSFLVNNPYGSLNGKENIIVGPDNGIYFYQPSGISGSAHKNIIMRVDGNKQIAWQYDFSILNLGFSGWNQLAPAPSNGIAGIGSGLNANRFNELSFLKLDSLGAGCNSGATNLSLQSDQISLVPMSWSLNNNLSFMVNDFPLSLNDELLESRLLCPQYLSCCDSSKMSKVNLPADTVLCSGYIMKLDAGTGYISYLWQDGSVIQTMDVADSGTYWVNVTDPNGCSDTDTIRVGSIEPLPASFLPADTTICIGDIVDIRPVRPFEMYKWSTGGVGNSLQIGEAGKYSLYVVDKYGCAGNDSIQIKTKSCPMEIFFPNAFTPNKDGLNDIFKPVIIATPVIYQFKIYNRFGQLIFKTSDPGKGWDGMIGNAAQETGAYVWMCTYQFSGGKKNVVSGTVILMR